MAAPLDRIALGAAGALTGALLVALLTEQETGADPLGEVLVRLREPVLPPISEPPVFDPWLPQEEPMPNVLPGEPHIWDNQIIYAAALYGMARPHGPLLLKAIMQHESGFREDARGDFRAGTPAYRGDSRYAGYCSLGLLQVNRCAHADLATRYDLRDGDQNILAGGELLAREWHLYWPDVERVVIGYNGPAVAARGAPYSNQGYADRVLPIFSRNLSSAGVT